MTINTQDQRVVGSLVRSDINQIKKNIIVARDSSRDLRITSESECGSGITAKMSYDKKMNGASILLIASCKVQILGGGKILIIVNVN